MASTIFSSPAICDLADAVDEELRHRRSAAQTRLRLDKLLLHSRHQKRLLIGSAELNLALLSCSKVIELNQRRVVQYVSPARPARRTLTGPGPSSDRINHASIINGFLPQERGIPVVRI
jgi:hypothetical protein